MKPDKAKELIKETFEQPFDKDRFTWFVKNLFPDKIEFRNKVYTGNYIKEAYRAYVRKYEQIGKFEDEEGNTIDLLVVELLKGQSVERARTSQRNFIAQYLKNKNHREGALVAFYSEGSDDWRFSFIKMEYSLEKKKDDLTPAKRFSFLVGKDEKSHTAQNQLAGLLTMQSVPLMQELEQAFNIETVTKEFFEKYKQLFLDLNDHIEKEIKKSRQLREELESKNIDSAAFTKKLLGQIVFLYFLQKKGWLGVPKNENWGKGDKRFLRSLLDKAESEKETFFADYLVYLFYEALATEQRGGSDSSYYKKLDCRIPFLNGGLFEADYNWEKITVDIPNKLFTNRNKTKEVDEGDGILDVFDRFNFTVKEDEPLEKEVAVDPEMLGKVFENLLEVKDRKSKGAFYTPREIVHYMCQESLIAYLDTSVNGEATSFQKIGTDQTDMFGNKARKGQLPLEAEHGSKIKVNRKDIEKFIREGVAAIDNDTRVIKEERETETYSFQMPISIINTSAEIDKALANIRICDPAIGSGAFPVGMMNEIVKAREILSVYLKKVKQKDRTPYELKRHTIQECIYGVDIDHSAIDIAKLRLWLSLVVDEDDFYKIKPLPNLDYKIVQGNSLVGMPYEPQASNKLEELRKDFFSLTDPKQKTKYRSQINTEIQNLLSIGSKQINHKIDFDFKLFFSEVFHFKKGFDIVIGNPPYGANVDHQQLNIDFTLSKRRLSNTYSYFMEKGLRLLNNNGNVTLIVPNTWLSIKSSIALRKALFVDNTVAILIFTHQVFESMSDSPPAVDTVIYSCLKGKHYGQEINVNILNQGGSIKDRLQEIASQNWYVKFKTLITEENEYKIEVNSRIVFNPQSTFLLETKVNPNYIVRIGTQEYAVGKGNPPLNKSLIKNRIYHSKVRLNKSYLPYVPCGDIQPFYFNWSKTFLKWGDNLHCPREKEIYSQEHLLVSRIFDKKRQKLKVCYMPQVSGSDFYVNSTDSFNVLATQQNKYYSIKFLLSILGSKLVGYMLSINNVNLIRVIYPKINTGDLKNILIPKDISEESQKKITALIDKILEMKKQDPKVNTSSREKQIDVMVYHLYNLSFEEAKIIDAELTGEEFQKYKL